MSMGTMVTIVLLMVVLVLGIFFIQKIFGAGTNAIDTIDSEVQNQIAQLFSQEGKKIGVYPTSRRVTIKKGSDPIGFAYSIKSTYVEEKDFTYNIGADPNFDFTKCGSSFTEQTANSWLLLESGSFTLSGGSSFELPELVLFTIPESAPPCTIPYRIDVENDEGYYVGTTVYITIK